MKSPKLRNSAVHSPFTALLFVAAITLAACTARSTTAATPTSTVPAATSTPSLPALTSEPGWHSVLRIGYVSPGVITSGGTFATTKPFQVAVVCVGAGKLVITYATESDSFQCMTSPQQHGVIDLHPPTGQISVSVSADYGVAWQGFIEVQD